MDLFSLTVIISVLIYLGVLLYLANQIEVLRNYQAAPPHLLAPQKPSPPIPEAPIRTVRWLLYGVLGMTFLIGVVVVQTGLAVRMADELGDQLPSGMSIPEVSLPLAVVVFGLALVVSVLSFQIITSLGWRQRIQRLVGPSWGFDPHSMVHTVATVLMLCTIVWMLATFVLQGGLDGAAESVVANGINPGDVVFQGVLLVMIALLGVGMGIRRSLPDTAARLGLRVPIMADITWGIGFGLLFLGLLLAMAFIWVTITPPDVFEDQTAVSQQIAQAVSALPLALLFSATAAISEEILIRGALQPIFGIVASSLFFVALHTQYALTPATLIILVVSLGLGWLRQRQSTNAAIVAHFVFNILQFV